MTIPTLVAAAVFFLMLVATAAYRRLRARPPRLPPMPFGSAREDDRELSRARADLVAIQAHAVRRPR
jgi:uncharacterized membrane protein